MNFFERWHDYWSPKEAIDTSPRISDEVKYTTCYMCACRCGIKVHLKDGAIRYIEGNPKHPVNRGVICGKGASGIMQQQSPAKLTKPLMRVGERGSGEFREIEWDEAIETALLWLSRIRADDPKKLAFFTGRDQSQSLTGFWATQFGTPNFAAHGGFCSVNMAAAGMYTIRNPSCDALTHSSVSSEPISEPPLRPSEVSKPPVASSRVRRTAMLQPITLRTLAVARGRPS